MSEKKRVPLKFWIGSHRDGSGRQCIVDFHDGPMEGVKAAWDEKNEKRLTTMETVIQPDLDHDAETTLELLRRLEGHFGGGREIENLLKRVVMAAYEQGMQVAALRPKRP